MELNNRNIKKILLIITVSILIFLGVQKFDMVLTGLRWLYNLLSPIIVGICIAFIFNVLLKLLEERVFARLARFPRWERYKRGVCTLLTYLIIIGILFILMFMIVPELQKSFATLISNIPYYADSFQKWLDSVMKYFNISPDFTKRFEIDWEKLVQTVQEVSPRFFNTTMGITSTIFSGLFNFVLGVVFSIYLLLHKEKLCLQLKKVVYAFFHKKHADYLVNAGRLSNKIFARFVSGQLTEAVIIGLLCFIGMNIFRMPYSLLISTVVGLTALIPIFGAFIGTALGAFILLMIRPMTALWFIVFIIVLQQIEGNVIYPKVVGSSIGLPGIWVLFAVTVGGSVFGIMGMLIGVPLSSVLYCLFRQAVEKRLEKKNLTI